jgi:hypothetical protein
MESRQILICVRLFFGLLALAAIGAQLFVHIQNGFNIVNFFSYFTNLSNIFAAVILVIGAINLIKHREPTAIGDLMRGASVLSMAIVGIVFNILLRNEDLGLLLPWVNIVVHYVMPIIVVFDWFFQRPKTKLSFKNAASWLILPLLYLVFSITRGSIVGWYPYPFLDPSQVGGYGIVALYCLSIFAFFIFVSWLMMAFGNKALTRELS